jgi:hypothetical protein
MRLTRLMVSRATHAEFLTDMQRPALTVVPRPDRVPLSFAQRRLWFIARLEGPSGTYNVPVAVRLAGRADAVALRAALADVAGRHESLRTVFPDEQGVPFQRVLDGPAGWPVLGEVAAAGERDVAAAVAAAAGYRFDISAEVPLRATLVSVAGGGQVLVLVVHHIAADGWSLGPLCRDLAAAYAARRAGGAPGWEPLPVQYADYALWQRALLGDEQDPGSVAAVQAGYWKQALAGLPEELALPADRPRPAVASYRGGQVLFEVPAGVHAGLAALARVHGATVFMVMQAAVAVLLSRLGAGTDIPLGVPVAGRLDEALDELAGFFVNTLVLRADVSGDPDFAALLGRVRDVSLAGYAHQDLPFERLVEILNPARSLARNPLFQVMVTDAGLGPGGLVLAGLDGRAEPAGLAVQMVDLTFAVAQAHTPAGEPAGISGQVGYAADLFDAGPAGGWGRGWCGCWRRWPLIRGCG